LAVFCVYAYCGTDWRPEPTFIAWAQTLPEHEFGRSMRWCSQNLCIFNNAGVAFARQIKHNLQGHGVYLLGETAPRSIWYYYPVAMAIKLPLPLLLAPIGIFFLKPRASINQWTLATAALMLFSLNCHVQIGIRLVLPILVFLSIGTAVAFARAIGTTSVSWKRQLFIGCTFACLTLTSFSTVSAWPNGLSYVNEAWGGNKNAHRLLSDSNCDWGQGLPELAEWARCERIDQICVWYFGTDPRINCPPFVHLPVHREAIFDVRELRERLNGRKFAVSKTLLFGGYKSDPRQRELLNWLRSRSPVAQTATFLVFDLSDREVANQ
jgi:hypothetical protein